MVVIVKNPLSKSKKTLNDYVLHVISTYFTLNFFVKAQKSKLFVERIETIKINFYKGIVIVIDNKNRNNFHSY